MEILPIDLTEILAVVLALSIVLVPVLGLTARFALKPMVEALSRVFESREAAEAMRIMERRVAYLEQQVESLEAAHRHLQEASSFDAQLHSGSGTGEGTLPPSASSP